MESAKEILVSSDFCGKEIPSPLKLKVKGNET